MKRKAKRSSRRRSNGSVFDQHPNLKMLLYMFVLSVILWVLTYQYLG